MLPKQATQTEISLQQLKKKIELGAMAQGLNPSTWEAGDQPGLHNETRLKTKQNKKSLKC